MKEVVVVLEMLVGVAFAAAVLAVPYVYDKVGNGKFSLNIKLPSRKKDGKDVEEKMKEIDEKLNEVVSAAPSERKESIEKVAVLEEAAKNVEVREDLLDEMQTAETLSASSAEVGDAEDAKPELPELPELPEDTSSDLEVDTEEIDKEFSLMPTDEDADEEEEEEEENVDFDEEDELIASLAKEVETKEEEEIDLLRDLKGQKFDVEELESELKEVLQRLKALT